MNITFSLGSAANTSNPALYVLSEKGYSIEVKVTRSGRCYYIATKEQRQFVGNSGPETLGLVAMWEVLGDDWMDKIPDMPDILAESISEEE